MKETSKTTSTSQFFLWFGASISIAEIMTGALVAPLGFQKGVSTIFVGHLIGMFILFGAAWMSSKNRQNAIASTEGTFGKTGAKFFATLNMVQLVGWAAVVITMGTHALRTISIERFALGDTPLWAIAIGALLICWIVVGLKKMSIVHSVIVFFLFLFTLVLAYTIFGQHPLVFQAAAGASSITYSEAVELSTVMCLSWLPVIGDYSKFLQKPLQGTVTSVFAYGIGSSFMFILGLGGALYVGSADIGQILLASGFGLIALFLIFLSTIVTTFLDCFSAGVNCQLLFKRVNPKVASILFTIFAVFVALTVPSSVYEQFLYWIGSIFAPLYGILFMHEYVLKKRVPSFYPIYAMFVWVVGVCSYYATLSIHLLFGHTIWILIGTGLIYGFGCFLLHKLAVRKKTVEG